MIPKSIALLLLLSITGCTTNFPDMGTLYNEAARQQSVVGNPVILIPGVLGSTLVDRPSGSMVWGAFRRGSSDPDTPEGARLLALPMAEGVPLNELQDEVYPDGVLDSIKISPLNLPLTLAAYRNLLKTMGAAGYRDEELGVSGSIDYGKNHYTCFQFDYDWRRSNVENAILLDAFIEEKKAYIQREKSKRGSDPSKEIHFDIVAHSMGGLLARYYLRYGNAELPPDGTLPELTWAGARHIDRVILVGTPSGGSAKSLLKLVNGVSYPTIVKLSPALLGTSPSLYEMMPRVRHGAVVSGTPDARPIDFMDPNVWEQNQWGLADPQEDKMLQRLLPDLPDAAARRAVALDHLHKCLKNARQFHAALDLPATLPQGTDITLITGDAEKTPSVLTISKRRPLKTVRFAPGDGIVTRTSAIMDEREGHPWVPRIQSPIAWDQIIFLFESHQGMTKSPEFVDNMLYVLLDKPRTD